MDAMFLMLAAFAGYIVMYRLYGRFIGRKIFALTNKNISPSVEFEDGMDFVPTKKEVIFGHHFTSIAGTGPIVGPAIAVIWGWVPAMLWIFIGSIVMGAVHDFGALVVSMRNQGKSVSEYASKYINPRTKYFLFFVVFMDLLIITAIFGLVIAVIFNMFPASVLPVWLEVPIAILLGYMVYKRGKNVTLWSIFAVIAMYVTVVIGTYLPIQMPSVAGIPATGVWTILLLAYAFIASTLPVTTLLQPRDFINSHQLVIALVLLVLGTFIAAFAKADFQLVAPAVQANPVQAPPMLPFLFITIACGAISGFHALVSSGTTSKQVRLEEESLFVGYGGMLTEASLSTLVIIATAAGIAMGYTVTDGGTLFGMQAWTHHYASWAAAAGLGSKISAFVVGAANMIASIGIPKSVAVVIMGVFVASFAGTTMDTATRIERYVLTELFTGLKVNIFKNRYFATGVAVVLAGTLAFWTGADGKGALQLWPLFGGINQILAALVLATITVYLRYEGGTKWVISAVPAVFLAGVTLWALFINQTRYRAAGQVHLEVLNAIIILCAIWVIVEGLVKFFRVSGPEAVAPSEA